jgi:uncharacterized protein (DUF433 family)
MTLVSIRPVEIIRTERGLTIEGTRITLYDVMDYVTSNYSSKFIRAMLDLTDEQIRSALSYIEENREEVDAEYQLVLKESEELQKYYEVQNRERLARIAAQPPKPGTEAIRAKLQAKRSYLSIVEPALV